MTENVRLQSLRDFTVQIRDANDQIVGTGIAVSTDGKIVTCAHVVEAAIGAHPRNANGAEVGVYFPQVRGGDEKNRRATIAKYFEDSDDDVVLLQLTKGSSPLAPEQIPVLGTANSSEENPFRSYGYRRLDQYVAGWAHGTIQGSIEVSDELNVQCEPVQLESSQINSGMSGSAVLDIDRNLVVGIVSETWFPDLSTKDRDTAWAVDGQVLSLKPLGLLLQTTAEPLKPAPEPRTDEATKKQVIEVAQDTVAKRSTKEKFSWNSAPSVLTEWTGRDHFLEQITDDWADPKKHVTGLIGFGGEGKSSLARKWVETLERANVSTLDGLFWWGFYENRSVDEFIEAALKYMSGGHIDPRQVQSSNLRAQIIGAMLGSGCYLFILDGLEVMQHQEGDQYGLLQSNDLRDLLTFFARPDNKSFCLVTSRAPLLDLMDYTTYTHRDVERLSEEDGRALLQRLGVKGRDDELDKVVADWDGHALTLSILAAYLAERYKGDIQHLADIPVPTADEPRYERVHRVLRRYDEHLTETQRIFLKFFSVFRTPVTEDMFESVFRRKENFKPFTRLLTNFIRLLIKSIRQITNNRVNKLNNPLVRLSDESFTKLVKQLLDLHILRYNMSTKEYTAHSLVRGYYSALLSQDSIEQTQAIHKAILGYYSAQVGLFGLLGRHIPSLTLDDLKPEIERTYHACLSGEYDFAFNILSSTAIGIRILTDHLGAYETCFTLLLEFFPKNDISQDPLVSAAEKKRDILNETGFALMKLGKLNEAVSVFERAIVIAQEKDVLDKASRVPKNIFLDGALGGEITYWNRVSGGYQNLSDLYVFVGDLDSSLAAAIKALNFARRPIYKLEEGIAMGHQAWTYHLKGELGLSSEIFSQAKPQDGSNWESLREKDARYCLYGNIGIRHADHMRRISEAEHARKIISDILELSQRKHWPDQNSICHHLLGDLDSDAGLHDSAQTNYDAAVKIAQSISDRGVLIEALLARGRWHAKHMKNANAAFTDLNEALGYCVESSYRIYEADVRVALVWAYLANGEKEKAKASAERALGMSNEMGYHWGKVDAQDVIARIDAEP